MRTIEQFEEEKVVNKMVMVNEINGLWLVILLSVMFDCSSGEVSTFVRTHSLIKFCLFPISGSTFDLFMGLFKTSMCYAGLVCNSVETNLNKSINAVNRRCLIE